MKPMIALVAALALAAPAAAPAQQPLRPGDFIWDDEAEPGGRSRVVVDLAAEELVLYQDGREIGRSSILFGADDKPTPLGRYKVLEKRADHVSNIYGSPMPHMLRLTWDGIAIHGSNLRRFAATHGCIGVPRRFAELMFAHVRKGDEVIVTAGRG